MKYTYSYKNKLTELVTTMTTITNNKEYDSFVITDNPSDEQSERLAKQALFDYFQKGGSLSAITDVAKTTIQSTISSQGLKLRDLELAKNTLILCIECKENYYSHSGLIGLISKVLSSIGAILFNGGETNIDKANALAETIESSIQAIKLNNN